MPARSAFNWVLEVLAFMALAATILIVAAHWTEIPAQSRNISRLLPLTAVAPYILMTAAARDQGLINVPIAIDRDAPQVRRLLKSTWSGRR